MHRQFNDTTVKKFKMNEQNYATQNTKSAYTYSKDVRNKRKFDHDNYLVSI